MPTECNINNFNCENFNFHRLSLNITLGTPFLELLEKRFDIIYRICNLFSIPTNMFVDFVCNKLGITLRHTLLHACLVQ
jgi:hypothetical protein